MKESKDSNIDKYDEKTRPIFPTISFNNRIILETYKEDRGLKATVQNGFAMVQQKVSLKGLKVLADARVNNGTHYGEYITKGDTAYIKESLLQNQQWAKSSFTSDAIEGEFIIVDITHVEFVVRK